MSIRIEPYGVCIALYAINDTNDDVQHHFVWKMLTVHICMWIFLFERYFFSRTPLSSFRLHRVQTFAKHRKFSMCTTSGWWLCGVDWLHTLSIEYEIFNIIIFSTTGAKRKGHEKMIKTNKTNRKTWHQTNTILHYHAIAHI